MYIKAVFSLIFTAPVLFFGSVSYADYEVSKYDPDYRPHNLEQAFDFGECDDLVEAFDLNYTQLTEEYISEQSNPDGKSSFALQNNLDRILQSLETNKFNYQIEFSECISEGKNNIEEQEAEEARERFEQQRIDRIQRALDECDFDFFDRMDNDEKMDTYDERQSCREKAVAEEEVGQTEEINSSVIETSNPEPASIQPVTYTPPPVEQNTPSPAPTPVSDPEAETNISSDSSKDEEMINSSSSTTTEEKVVEVTENELNQMVEERVNKALEEVNTGSEPIPEPEKPSVFKRVFSFLFGWLN